MYLIRCLLAAAAMVMLSCPVYAEWVQGEAKLAVKNVPLDDVRIMAIKNAIADASFKSGSLITAEDVVLNGLLISSKAEIHSTGRIQRVEIIDETLEDGYLTVSVKVNITPIFACDSDKYSRSVLVTQFQLLRPRQAAHGDIYDFGHQISKRLEQQLIRQQQQLNVQLLDKAFASTSAFNSLTPQIIYDKASYLAQTQGRQFIVFGYIRDISLFEQINIEDDDDVSRRRNFTLDVYVVDAFRNSLLFQESYHAEADWSYPEGQSVDTNNSLFWRGDLGRVALNTVNAAVSDITSIITCEATVTQVVDKLSGELVIGMGSADGVVVGDTFALLKKRTLSRTTYTGLAMQNTLGDVLFTVAEVNPHAALLKSTAAQSPALADLYDLVMPAPAP